MPNAIPFNRSTKAETAPESDASAEELLAFERMLADLSARFANVPADKVELEFRVVQAILLKFLGFDRCSEIPEADPRSNQTATAGCPQL